MPGRGRAAAAAAVHEDQEFLHACATHEPCDNLETIISNAHTKKLLNQPFKTGRLPLVEAIRHDNVALVTQLLGHGVDVLKKDKKKSSGLLSALCSPNRTYIQLIVEQSQGKLTSFAFPPFVV